MTAEGFQYKEFAEDLSSQASAVLPANFSQEEKQYVINIIKNFCFLTGQAICQDPDNNFTVDQASIITQFIGEWTFHKAVDSIKGNVPPQFRDSILQKVAFTVFEIAKQAILKNIPQEQMLDLVEHHVKKTYEGALAELIEKGAMSQEQAEAAVKQSSIDDMAQQSNDALNNIDDAKLLKLVSFAVVLKKLPQDKATSILSKFSEQEANIMLQYLYQDNLETLIDQELLIQSLSALQEDVSSDVPNIKKVFRSFAKIINTLSNEEKQNLIDNERLYYKQLILEPAAFEKINISMPVFNILRKYTEKKIYDYKKTKAR